MEKKQKSEKKPHTIQQRAEKKKNMKHTQILHLLTINLSAISNVYDSLEW